MNGYFIHKEKVIDHPSGAIKHFIKTDSSDFKSFGELYFSVIKKGSIKGWKQHSRMTSNIKVIKGKVTFLFQLDNHKKIDKIDLCSTDNIRLTIYPNTWFAFYANQDSEILNFADIKHDINEQNTKEFDKSIL